MKLRILNSLLLLLSSLLIQKVLSQSFDINCFGLGFTYDHDLYKEYIEFTLKPGESCFHLSLYDFMVVWANADDGSSKALV